MDLIGELFVIVLDKLINKLAKKPDDGGSGSGNGRAVAATVTKGPQWYNKPYDKKCRHLNRVWWHAL